MDLDRIAAVIGSYRPDVVALQEVDVCRLRSGGVDQAQALADRLGLASTFAACIVWEGAERYGLATLSRWPVDDHEVLELPARHGRRRAEPRRALVTRVRWPGRGRPLTVMNTHLSVKRAERPAQIAALVEAVRDDDVIVLGDLNCGTRGASYRTLARRLRAATPRLRTWPARLPLVQLDHVLYRGSLQPVVGGVWTGGPARQASDHLPVVARFAAGAEAA